MWAYDWVVVVALLVGWLFCAWCGYAWLRSRDRKRGVPFGRDVRQVQRVVMPRWEVAARLASIPLTLLLFTQWPRQHVAWFLGGVWWAVMWSWVFAAIRRTAAQRRRPQAPPVDRLPPQPLGPWSPSNGSDLRIGRHDSWS